MAKASRIMHLGLHPDCIKKVAHESSPKTGAMTNAGRTDRQGPGRAKLVRPRPGAPQGRSCLLVRSATRIIEPAVLMDFEGAQSVLVLVDKLDGQLLI